MVEITWKISGTGNLRTQSRTLGSQDPLKNNRICNINPIFYHILDTNHVTIIVELLYVATCQNS